MSTRKTKDPKPKLAADLFNYLSELVKLKMAARGIYTRPKERLCLAELPDGNGTFHFAATDPNRRTRPGEWLRMEKPRLEAAPVPPERLTRWLDPGQLAQPTLEPPRLLESRPYATVSGMQYRRRSELHDAPTIAREYEQFCREWESWSGKGVRDTQSQSAHGRLFRMHKMVQDRSDDYEAVLGVGMLLSQTETSEGMREIRQHLLIARGKIEFDLRSGAIRVVPAAGGSTFELEDDFLSSSQRSMLAAHREEIDQALEGISTDAPDWGSIAEVLGMWCNAAGLDIDLDESTCADEEIGPKPRVLWAPALVIRRKTQRGLARFLAVAAQQLGEMTSAEQVPPMLRDAVSEAPADSLNASDSEKERAFAEASSAEEMLDAFDSARVIEAYFPLLSNDEQRRLIQQLEIALSVRISGPPGTGKTQLIANLLCHCLATGKSILVTSESGRALEVLREKIPESMRPLCAMFLGTDETSRRWLESSVRTILKRSEVWPRGRRSQLAQISELDQRLRCARLTEKALMSELTSLREAEVMGVDRPLAGRYSGTPKEIARQLKEERERYAWVQDLIPRVSEDTPLHEAPLSGEQLKRFLDLEFKWNAEGDTQEQTSRLMIDALPTPEAYRALLEKKRAAAQHWEACSANHHPDTLKIVKLLDSRDRVEFANSTSRLHMLLSWLDSVDVTWVRASFEQALDESPKHLQRLFAHSQRVLKAIRQRSRNGKPSGEECDAPLVELLSRVGDTVVTGLEAPPTIQLARDAGLLRMYRQRPWWSVLKPGGRVREPASVRRFRHVRVDGRFPRTPGAIDLLVDWITVHAALAKLDQLWGDCLDIPQDVSTPERMNAYRQAFQYLGRLMEALTLIEGLHDLLNRSGCATEVDWTDGDKVAVLSHADSLFDAWDTLREATRQLESLMVVAVTPVVGTDGGEAPQGEDDPLAFALAAALDAQDVETYDEVYDKVRQLNDQQLERTEHQDLRARLGDGVLEKLDLHTQETHQLWRERAEILDDAWCWMQAGRALVNGHKVAETRHCLDSLRQVRGNIQKLLADLTEKCAWANCLDRIENQPGLKQDLLLWQSALNAQPKREAKRFKHWRKTIRKYQDRVVQAMGAWVLPLQGVADQFCRMGQDGRAQTLFDVVVIDESSQSGPEALALLHLARKLVVVGDVHQNMPINIGVAVDSVDDLRRRRLPEDVPRTEMLLPEVSIFESIRTVLGGATLHLREHFRCRPEIINFCNELCYLIGEGAEVETSLIALRQPVDGWKEPPIRTLYVEDAELEGPSGGRINRAEAKAIVDQVIACCADPTYDGKTMGIVSLQGEAQANLIWTELLNRLPADEIARRNLLSGTSRAFQGAERDVIFLSMVASKRGNTQVHARTAEQYVRMYNVAVSRARDQLWLFHSVRLDELRTSQIDQEDLRARLLKYCLAVEGKLEEAQLTRIDQLEPASKSQIETWRAAAEGEARAQGKTPADLGIPFDSWFEVDVILRIAERGYCVAPQFAPFGETFEDTAERAGGGDPFTPRIDIVVVGTQTVLGVECDGDSWHGRARFEHDLMRQRDLERCGWHFWRVRSGVFYFDPDRALSDLWEKLEEMGINPVDGDTPHPSDPSGPAGGDAEPEEDVGQELESMTVEVSAASGTDDAADASDGADENEEETDFEEAEFMFPADADQSVSGEKEAQSDPERARGAALDEPTRAERTSTSAQPDSQVDALLRQLAGTLTDAPESGDQDQERLRRLTTEALLRGFLGMMNEGDTIGAQNSPAAESTDLGQIP